MWKFEPILKPTIWGGNKIFSYRGEESQENNIGESWLISGLEGDETRVSEGSDKGLTVSELLQKYGSALTGKSAKSGESTRFPLLVKLIDSNSDLSVQVHPDDATAISHGYENGKSEMWYIIDAAPGAKIANGFSREVTPQEYDRLIETGKIEEVLNYTDVNRGEIYYIPAGRVHSICAGCLLVEVQQTSGVTYRIYDYNRKDDEGNYRKLHTCEARESIRFDDQDGKSLGYAERVNVPVNVIQSDHFTVNILDVDQEMIRDYREADTFRILVLIEGKAEIESQGEMASLKQGEMVLIPASVDNITIRPEGSIRMLETYTN
ncbi:MAG: type I phosphomannose isomerase catalytic subunit [Lepagella sp.]